VEAEPRSLPIIEARGGPRERGLAIGHALAAPIRGHLDGLKRALAPAVGPADDYLRQLLADTDFKSAILQHTPDLMAELEATAEGAGIAADELYALQLLDEEWAYRARRVAAGPRDKCSSLAIVDSPRLTWIAQNMDLAAYTDGFQALLSVDDGEHPPALVFTAAGMIGLMGVNAAGVGVCVNSLPQLPSGPEGLPVAFVLRRLLQARSADEACRFLTALPHATNQHYLIAGPGEVRSFEASCATVVAYRPADPSRVLHTNHPLTDAPATPEPASARENSVARLAALEARLGDGPPGLADIRAALSSCDDERHPVCREGGAAGFTTGSMISALSPDRVESWASAGPPASRGYHYFALRTHDPIMAEIFAARARLRSGDRAGARNRLASVWSRIGAGPEPIHEAFLAHYMADLHDDPAGELAWDLRALDAAQRRIDGDAQRHAADAATLAAFMPSLHLNLAAGYLRAGDLERSQAHLAMARPSASELAEDSYGRCIRASIEALASELAAKGRD
jgi:hypothetical protein